MAGKLKVTQHYRVTRTITIPVEGDDPLYQYQDDKVDLPEWSDERWEENWSLVSEDADAV